MQIEIKFTLDDQEDSTELRWLGDYRRNGVFVDCLYDEVFRPIIRYSEDMVKVQYYEELWQEIYQFLDGLKE